MFLLRPVIGHFSLVTRYELRIGECRVRGIFPLMPDQGYKKRNKACFGDYYFFFL